MTAANIEHNARRTRSILTVNIGGGKSLLITASPASCGRPVDDNWIFLLWLWLWLLLFPDAAIGFLAVFCCVSMSGYYFFTSFYCSNYFTYWRRSVLCQRVSVLDASFVPSAKKCTCNV